MNKQQNTFDLFNNTCASFIRNVVYPPLIAYFKDNDIEITEDDLDNILKVPVPTSTFSKVSSFSPRSKERNTGVDAKTKQPKKSTATLNPIKGEQCEHFFTRGNTPNMYCGKPVKEGSIYCATCTRNKNKTKKAPGIAAAVPASKAKGIIPGKAPKYDFFRTAPTNDTVLDNFTEGRSVHPATGYIVDDNGDVVVGKINPDVLEYTEVENYGELEILPLTLDDEKTVKSMGLKLVNKETQKEKTRNAKALVRNEEQIEDQDDEQDDDQDDDQDEDDEDKKIKPTFNFQSKNLNTAPGKIPLLPKFKPRVADV